MALFKRKLKKDTAKKQKYLKYYRQTKAQGRRPLTYGMWDKMRKVGGSRQLREGIAGLSPSDAAAVSRMMGRRKKK